MAYELSIRQICDLLKAEGLYLSHSDGCDDLTVKSICYDSRQAQRPGLFICKGTAFKKEYLAQAVGNGAVCYLSEKAYENAGAYGVLTSDVRKAMSVVAKAFYRNPSRELRVTGLTGTKGKTTTAYYLKGILDRHTGGKTAVLSTVEVYTGKTAVEAHLTTPESLDLQRYFAETAQSGIHYLTMEVSSQAYKLDRVYGQKFDIGVFMNIDEDHIGPLEHSDFEDYFSCKLELMKNCDRAVVCSGCDHLERVLSVARAHAKEVVLAGFRETDDFFVSHVTKLPLGFSFLVTEQATGFAHTYTITQEGRFNIENALCAITVARLLGVSPEAIEKGISGLSVKGRMNVFENGGVKTIVDYAHNHLSFLRLFESLRADYPDAPITVVGGAPGGKAINRRREIGTLCGRFAQKVYLTAEDPQFEEVRSICEEMAGYIQPFGVPFEIEPNRTLAIEKALLHARPGEIVIVAGKGEEVYQKVRGAYEYYESDLSIVRRCMEHMPQQEERK